MTTVLIYILVGAVALLLLLNIVLLFFVLRLNGQVMVLEGRMEDSMRVNLALIQKLGVSPP
jgi:hypothetical protein